MRSDAPENHTKDIEFKFSEEEECRRSLLS
jgi:hypothetical protein